MMINMALFQVMLIIKYGLLGLVQYGPDRIIITPEPILNSNGKLTVREGETIGPFVCTADCNPSCVITWKVKKSDKFNDAHSQNGTLLQQPVQRNMQLFRCRADWEGNISKENLQLDVQYLDEPLLYINDEMKSNSKLTEYTPLRISCHVDGNPTPTIRLSRGQADTELEQRQGTSLNYTIDTAHCTDTDTYVCRGTSTVFNNRNKVFNINVICNTSFDSGGNFKSSFSSKSGIDTKVNVAVPIIANPPPQISDLTWDGPVPVSVRTSISRGDVIYKHVIRSSIPVKDRNYFGNYTLSYNGEIINKITIYPEEISNLKTTDDDIVRLYIAAISLLSILLGLTWLVMASLVIYKRRYSNVHQNCKHGEDRIQLESQNMTEHYADVHNTVVDKLEVQNISQHYEDVQGTVDEGKYKNAKGRNTVVEGFYTELGRRDSETPYEKLKE